MMMVQHDPANSTESSEAVHSLPGWEIYDITAGGKGVRRTLTGRLNTEAGNAHALVAFSFLAGVFLPLPLCLLRIAPPDALPLLVGFFWVPLPLLILLGGFCWAFLSAEELYRQGDRVTWERRLFGRRRETTLIGPVTLRLQTRVVRKNRGKYTRVVIQSDLFLDGRGRCLFLESRERALDDAARAFPDQRPEDDSFMEQLAAMIENTLHLPIVRR